jgi:ABC-type amino acid transport substrate-binding protein
MMLRTKSNLPCSLVWSRAFGIILFLLLLNLQGAYSQSKPLVIAVEDDAAPWSRADGTGYANDVVVAAFKAVNVDVQLQVMPYARCKRMVLNGTLAACLSMSPSAEFAGLVELSANPLFTCFAGYFYNVDKPLPVNRERDLTAKTVVGTVIGYEYPAGFESLRKKGRIVVEESPSEETNLKKLALGRVDLALLTYNQVKSPEWLIARAGVAGKVRTTFRSGSLNSYIGFSKKHPEGPWARQQFNRGYRIITNNGILRRVQRSWTQKLTTEKP